MHPTLTRFVVVLVLSASPLSAARSQPETKPAAPYIQTAERLGQIIEREIHQKKLPAISIALVDDQRIVWARGFGFADAEKKKPATADTVYRVGSVSKLFTDLAIMQLVERGQIDIDAPVTKYVSDFKPVNRWEKAITLRHLMAHRSGLVREPPVGSYFDANTLSLEKTVRSLNQTELLYEPGTKVKYSNAGIAVAGFALEQSRQEPFARALYKMLLDPMGMAKSSFEPSTEIQNDLAKAIMWTYSGTEFPAPTFELGMIPAGSMYSTVNDLAKFVSVLSARGKGLHGTIVSPMTLEEMWKPQFAKPGDKGGIGLGFFVSQRHGRRAVGHNGAMYGFATELAYLPEDKIGVIVAISCDVANPVATRIADHAIELMLAAKNKKPLPAPIVETAAVNRKIATHLAGKWVTADGKSIVLTERDGRLWLWPGRGGFRVELRQLGDDLVSDDRLGVGTRIKIEKTGRLVIGTDRYSPRPLERPNAVSDKWAGLIGEYGEDHNILYIHERDGRLWALIEWVFLYPLTEESPNVFRFPDFGLYHDERLVFERTKQGRASKVTAAGIEFQRRKILGEGETFAIKPIRQLQGLLKEARASSPPQESGDFLKPDLVDLEKLDGTLKLDIRYATTNNFLSTPFYSSSRAFLQRPAAEALVRVHRVLEKDGYGLLIHDAYRPWYVTKMFWEATPEKWRNFVADPMKGSRHNRGCAVDLTLFDRATGKPVVMPGVYDEFSDRSSPDYPGGTSLQRWHRDKLRRAMESEGFSVYEAEWWHFDYKDWKRYSILNKTFEQLFN